MEQVSYLQLAVHSYKFYARNLLSCMLLWQIKIKKKKFKEWCRSNNSQNNEF